MPVIVVSHYQFNLSAPYVERDLQLLTLEEAQVLNMVRSDEIRTRIENELRRLARPMLDWEETKRLQRWVAEIDRTFKFRRRRVSPAPVGPIEREKAIIASERLDSVVASKGEMTPSQIEEAVKKYFNDNPELEAEARRRIMARWEATSIDQLGI